MNGHWQRLPVQVCIKRTHTHTKGGTMTQAVGWRKCGKQMKNGKLTASYSSFSNIGAMQPLRDGNQQEMCLGDESGKRNRKRLRERTAS